jgi:hypothetical protein
MASDLSDDLIYDTIINLNIGVLEVEEFFKLDGIKLLVKKDKIGYDA